MPGWWGCRNLCGVYAYPCLASWWQRENERTRERERKRGREKVLARQGRRPSMSPCHLSCLDGNRWPGLWVCDVVVITCFDLYRHPCIVADDNDMGCFSCCHYRVPDPCDAPGGPHRIDVSLVSRWIEKKGFFWVRISQFLLPFHEFSHRCNGETRLISSRVCRSALLTSGARRATPIASTGFAPSPPRRRSAP